MVILDENYSKMTIVCLKHASWRSNQEWRSIGADTVISKKFLKEISTRFKMSTSENP